MAFLLYTVIPLASLFTIILLLWRRQSRNSLLINWPVVRMLPGLFSNSSRLHQFATDVLRQSGGTFPFKGPWLSGFDFLLTSDPSNLRHILSKNFDNYHKGPDYRDILDPLGVGFLSADGEIWKLQRRLIHSFLKQSKFEMGLERLVQQKIVKALFSVLDHSSNQGTELDLQNVFHRFTFDNSCHMTLGFDPNCLSVEFPQVPIQTAYDEMEEALFCRHIMPGFAWKLQRWAQVGKEKKLSEAQEVFDRFLYECISRKREEAERKSRTNTEDSDFGFNFLEYVLLEEETEDQDKDVFRKSEKLLRDVSFNLLPALSDTISAGMVWLLWLVANHPIVERRILEEIKSNQQESGNGIFTFEELNKLVYLHAAINEALRLYPPIPFEHIVSIGPDILPSGHRIGKSTRILYCPFPMGRMEELWGEDCLEFKPERWISEQKEMKKVSPYKFIAFNAGPRTCLGKDLAILQIKAVASAMIWNYRIHMVEDHPVSPRNSLVLRAKHGVKVKVSKRHA